MSARVVFRVRAGTALLVLGLSLALGGCELPPSPAPTSGIPATATQAANPAPTSSPAPAATRTALAPVSDVHIQVTGKTTDQTFGPRHVVRVPVSDSPLKIAVQYPGPIEADIDAVHTVQPTTASWRTELVGGGDPNTLVFGLAGENPGLVTLEINVTGYAPVRFSVALTSAGTPEAGATALPAETAAATAMVATAEPAIGTAPAQASTPAPATLASPQSVTLANDGASISMQPGDRFVLALGEDYDWTVTTGDPAVVSRVVNILTVRGSQGVYEAHQAGHTTLTATGDPACRKSQPACAAPSRQFQVQIVVQ